MKRRWYAFLFLAALVGLFGQRAEAMRTPLADIRAAITQPHQLTAATAASGQPADVPNQVRDASTWIVESIIPLGTTADGQPLALISLLIPNTSLDELSPASTRAGPYAAPETHTRVFCIVQPPLGLEIINSVLGAQVNSDGVPMVLVQQKEYLAWKPSHFWKGRQKGGTILGDPEWVEASKSHLNSYFVHKYDGWHSKLDDYPIMREIVKEPLFQNLERNSYQMYGSVAGAGFIGGGVAVTAPFVASSWWTANAWTAFQVTSGKGAAAKVLGVLFVAGSEVPPQWKDARTWNSFQSVAHLRPTEAAKFWQVVKAMRETVIVRPTAVELICGYATPDPPATLFGGFGLAIRKGISEIELRITGNDQIR